MIYEFEDVETGEYVELDIHPLEVAPLGAVMRHGDRTLCRVPSIPMGAMVRRDVAHVSHQLSRIWRGDGPDPAPRRDSKGRPVFHNRRETAEFAAKTGMHYDEL